MLPLSKRGDVIHSLFYTIFSLLFSLLLCLHIPGDLGVNSVFIGIQVSWRSTAGILGCVFIQLSFSVVCVFIQLHLFYRGVYLFVY